jgi:hypothetical protein
VINSFLLVGSLFSQVSLEYPLLKRPVGTEECARPYVTARSMGLAIVRDDISGNTYFGPISRSGKFRPKYTNWTRHPISGPLTDKIYAGPDWKAVYFGVDGDPMVFFDKKWRPTIGCFGEYAIQSSDTPLVTTFLMKPVRETQRRHLVIVHKGRFYWRNIDSSTQKIVVSKGIISFYLQSAKSGKSVKKRDFTVFLHGCQRVIKWVTLLPSGPSSPTK